MSLSSKMYGAGRKENQGPRPRNGYEHDEGQSAMRSYAPLATICPSTPTERFPVVLARIAKARGSKSQKMSHHDETVLPSLGTQVGALLYNIYQASIEVSRLSHPLPRTLSGRLRTFMIEPVNLTTDCMCLFHPDLPLSPRNITTLVLR